MKRCRSCRTKNNDDTGVCPVCGIEMNNARHQLTPVERRVRRAARAIRIVALFHLVLAAILLLILPETEKRVAVAGIALVNITLSIGLIRFDYRAYRMATVCYFAYGMVTVITVQLFHIPLALLLLYIIGNRTAKALFERRLPEK